MIRGSKICGISDSKTLTYLIDHPHHPLFVGFITNFKKSPRYVEIENLKKLLNVNKKKVKFVSVLVNPDEEILDKIKELNFDYYQLYDVDPVRTKFIKKKYNVKIITALTIENKKDVNDYILYENISDIILFDGKSYEKSIGFDHKLLGKIPGHINVMIAGNISQDNIPILNDMEYFIDISGALEDERGKKDLQKINIFLNNVYKYET